jgi:hypothetical protein
VYSVIANATSSGAGAATLQIYPALRKAPADNAAIYTDPLFLCALTSDVLDVDFDQCLKARGFTLNLQELP